MCSIEVSACPKEVRVQLRMELLIFSQKRELISYYFKSTFQKDYQISDLVNKKHYIALGIAVGGTEFLYLVQKTIFLYNKESQTHADYLPITYL